MQSYCMDIAKDNKGVQINITGKHNKYMMKRLTGSIPEARKRQVITDNNLDPQWFGHAYQLEQLNEQSTFLLSEISKKISSYRQQDVLKKRLDKDNLISREYVTKTLVACGLSCHYCTQDVFLVYERCRDMQQWSLDRINNDIGHNVGNVVVSCLKCNLQRKTRDSDKFVQTKQLVITREGIE